MVVDISQNLPIYINAIQFECQIGPSCARQIYAATSSIFVVQSINSTNQKIIEFETQNTQNIFFEKTIPLYGYQLMNPPATAFSVQTNILYATVSKEISKKETGYSILSFRAGMPSINSLYYVADISKPVAAQTFTVLTSSIDKGFDYVIGFRDTTTYSYFIPRVPTL